MFLDGDGPRYRFLHRSEALIALNGRDLRRRPEEVRTYVPTSEEPSASAAPSRDSLATRERVLEDLFPPLPEDLGKRVELADAIRFAVHEFGKVTLIAQDAERAAEALDDIRSKKEDDLPV